MQIIDNKALRLRVRSGLERFRVIPKHFVEDVPGGHEVTVFWGLDETRVLKNLGFRNVPSPIERTYDWPGRWRPMDHQRTTAGFLTLHRRAFCFNDPGTGKTLSALWAADYLMKRGEVRRTLIVCPLSIMQTAWMGDITNSVLHRSAAIAHHAKASRRIEIIQGDYEFVIINYDGLKLVANEIKADERFDLVIVDECFVAGTQIAVAHGTRSIEKLSVGETVLTSSGLKRIKRVIRNTSANLVTVRTSDGNETTCTADHPFFTDAGWVAAKNLVGRRLIREDELSDMRQKFLAPEASVDVVQGEGHENRFDLLTILRTETMARTASGGEPFQPLAAGAARERSAGRSALRGVQGASIGDDEAQGSQATSARRERHGDDADGASCAGVSDGSMGMELPDSVGGEARRLSYLLQARLRASNAQGGAGSGRELPQYVGEEAAGQQEGSEVGGAWVVGVTHHEQGSAVPVFNLEVEGTPHYFANGNLVHNCNAYANPSTDRWKALASIVGPETFLWMMTGTPAAQSPEHAYGLARLVCPSNVPKFAGSWKDKVMLKISTFKWIPKPDAKQIVFDALQPAVRFAKEDCLDLPPVMKETRFVPLTAQQAKYYEKLKNDQLVIAAGEVISAVNKAALVNKLLQVSCGGVYSENGQVVEFDATPRFNLLREVLEETDRKVLIFAMFRSSIDGIATYLERHGIKAGVIHGGVTATKRAALITDFQTQPHIQVLVMQPQATAHGITLTAADTVVFFGPVMSVELYLQCIARSDRKGQTSDKVRVIHIQSSPVEKRMFDAMDGRVTDHAILSKMFDEEMEAKIM